MTRKIYILWQCDICNKSFPGKQSLKIHKNLHNEFQQKIPCDICEKQFTKVQLLCHKKTHGDKILQCSKYPAKFATNRNLARHVVIHDQNRERKYSCDIC